MLKLYIIIALVLVFIIAFLINAIYQVNINKKVKMTSYNLFYKYGKVILENNKDYLIINGVKYEIMFHYLNKKTDLSINSPLIWEEKNHKSNILNKAHITRSDDLKIIIVYPSERKITRYINENEIEFVDLNKTYNFYIITLNNLEDLLIKLKNG